MSETAQSDLETEYEEDEVPHVEFDIAVTPSDPTLELLVHQVQQNDIVIPHYQRRYVWKIDQASRLIESFLMGLPVPQIFFYINENGQLEVIDGQQRILSVKYFFGGYFGDPDTNDKIRIFKLKGLNERSEYNGMTFDQLLERDKRRLRQSTLRAINIRQLKPSTKSDSVFHIFERLNTGGTHLRPQEIRNVVYRGQIVDELTDLNENQNWLRLLGMNNPHKNQKDVELILRLFSLFECWNQYENPMLQYLNHFMSKNRNFESCRARMFKKRFPQTVDLVNDAIDKPFRPRKVLNASVLEAVMVTLLEHSSITSSQLKSRYPLLFQDKEFVNCISESTTNTLVLKKRLQLAKAILSND